MLFTFFNVEIESGVYLSTLLLLPVIIMHNSFYRHRSSAQRSAYMVIFGLVMFGILQYLEGVYPKNSLPLEPIKAILIPLVVAILTRNKSTSARELFYLLPWVVVPYIVYVYFFVDWNSYDILRNRFQAPSFGSSNSLAYVVALCLLSLHSQFNSSRMITKVFVLVSVVILMLALIGSQSRGGLLTYLVGVFFLINSRLKTPFVFFVSLISVAVVSLTGGIIDSRYDLVNDISETGGSGRLIIWASLILELINNPSSLVFGKGPIVIDLFGVTVESAHSMIIQLVYNFGVLGLFFCSSVLWYFLRVIFSAKPQMTRTGVAVFAAIIFSSIIDSVFFNAQLLWLNAIIIAFILTSRRRAASALNKS